jgi:hypothetical protein
MKIIKLIVLFLFLSVQINAQTSDKQQIETAINAFAKAGDDRNDAELQTILNENFRVIVNRFPTPDKTASLTKEAYIGLIKAKKIGGDARKVNILSVDVMTHSAMAKVIFESEKAKFTSYLSYVLTKDKKWELVADLALMEKK